MRQVAGISERRACRTLGQHRSTQRKVPRGRADEERLREDIIELARQYGRYGYRIVTGLLNQAGWHVNHKRVERIWKREGLKVPPKQRKKARLWLNDGSCVRLRPERPNHVWSYDFVQDRTDDGRAYRTLNIIDEFTREALMIRVARKLNSTDVVDALLFANVVGEGGFKHQIDSMAAMQSMVRSGLGVTLLPCYVADQDPGLRRIDPDPVPDVGLDLWILYHPDIRRVHRLRLFADFIADAICADRGLFEGRRPRQ